MASVLYGVKAGRGFGALIAEPGMGKTTLLFNLLQQLGEAAKSAFLFQSHDTPRDFLRNLLLDLGVEDDGQDLVRMRRMNSSAGIARIARFRTDELEASTMLPRALDRV